MLRFDDKVVVITGAAIGIGRQYARFFAKRGAKLFLNDIGCNVNGLGQSSQQLSKLVAQLKKQGCQVVSNNDSVQVGEKIITQAIKTFGTVHILINNAGIIRDSSFMKMKDQDFKKIVDVNLNGTYKCSRAVWNIMREQKYGKIINTPSAVGLYGNFGQANYTTAKLAIHGLTMTLAKQGLSKNICVNSIAPIANSRMTETVFPPDMLAMIKPSDVACVVGYLTHQSTKINGQIFQVSGGYVSQVRWERSKGTYFKNNFTCEDVQAKFNQIIDFDKTNDYPQKSQDTFMKISAIRAKL